MLEIPESKTISIQACNILINKVISGVHPPTNKHKFAFYYGDPLEYVKLLTGRDVKSANGHGMFVDIHFDEDVCITIGDGTNMRYFASFEKHPDKLLSIIALHASRLSKTKLLSARALKKIIHTDN